MKAIIPPHRVRVPILVLLATLLAATACYAQAPFFITVPTNVTALPGDNITLSVQGGGAGPLSYQWLLNGVMIAGATGTNLALINVQPSNGGSYSVNLQNAFGVTNCIPAVVVVENSPLGMSDVLNNAPTYTVSQMVGLDNNSNAVPEAGEPNHDGKGGQHPLWMVWQPKSSGIATFYSLGSGFDTVLAVYTNPLPSALIISNLVAVTADDDSGPYLTSTVQFNALSGNNYYIAVDGYGPLAAGNIVLTWSLVSAPGPLPVILQQPPCFVAELGGSVTFNVQANGGSNAQGQPYPVTYQWMVDGVPIPNGNTSSLQLQNVRPSDAGNYVVKVNNGFGTVRSVPAFLQISAVAPDGSAQPVQATYKLGDQLSLGTAQPPTGHFRPNDGFGSAPVTGLSGTHYFSTTSTPTTAAWFSILATNNAPLLVTTEGSGFSNSFTLYSGPANAISINQLTKLTSSITNGYELTSRTNINAVSNVAYYAEVFGNGTDSGKATLSWAFNYSKAITRPPAGSILGTPGAVLTNTLDPPDAALWSINQTNIPGPAGTNATQPPLQSAIYGVVNTMNGAVTRDLVYQDVSSDGMSAAISGGNVTITYGPNSAARTLYIESSTSAAGPWSVIKTLPSRAGGGTITEPISGSGKFYRYSLTNP